MLYIFKITTLFIPYLSILTQNRLKWKSQSERQKASEVLEKENGEISVLQIRKEWAKGVDKSGQYVGDGEKGNNLEEAGSSLLLTKKAPYVHFQSFS